MKMNAKQQRKEMEKLEAHGVTAVRWSVFGPKQERPPSLGTKMSPFSRELVRLMLANSAVDGKLGVVKEVAEALGVSPMTVRNHLRRKEIREAISKMESHSDKEVLKTKEKIRLMVSKALTVVDEKMDSDDEAIALRAAGMTLDRDPDTRVAKDQPIMSVLSAEGLKAMADVMKEVKEEEKEGGKPDGRTNEANPAGERGLSGTA